jgi:acyl carrier protein
MIEDKVKTLLGKQFGMEPDTISLDAHLVNDLGADSLDIVEIVMGLEEAFGIEIDDHKGATTVQLIIDLVTKLQK